MSFRTSLSGLDAASTDLSVVGNNIANASTNGFKESRAEFVDVFATTFAGVSGNTPGSGVRVANVSQQFSQGNVEFTSSSLDLAINGEGFFVLSDDGSSAYTRAGAFSTDRDGFVVDSSGRQLQIFPANSNGTFNTGALSSLQLSTSDSSPNATTTPQSPPRFLV
jgi:flagellar hook protein FlgE